MPAIHPLQLKYYCLTEISMRANPDFRDDGAADKAQPSILINPYMMKHPENDRLYQISLEILLEEDSATSPYDFSVTIVGHFEIVGEIEQHYKDTLISINAPAMLYGAARDVILGLTLRGPHGAILLPTVTIAAPVFKDDESISADGQTREPKHRRTKSDTPVKNESPVKD